jgi:hypothetical protein
VIKFNKPENLNGAELIEELKTAGVAITESPYVDAKGDLYLEINDADAKKSEAVVAKHDGSTVATEPSIAEKLASVGLSIEELKTALSS